MNEAFVVQNTAEPEERVKRLRFLSFDELRRCEELRYRYHHALPLPYGVVPLAQSGWNSQGKVYVVWSDGVGEWRQDPVAGIPTLSWDWLHFLEHVRVPPTTYAGIRTTEEQRLRERIADNVGGCESHYAVPKGEKSAETGLTLSRDGDYQFYSDLDGDDRIYCLRGQSHADIPDAEPLSAPDIRRDLEMIHVGLYSHAFYIPTVRYRLSLPAYNKLIILKPNDPAPGVYHLLGLLSRQPRYENESPQSLQELGELAAKLTGGTLEPHQDEFDYTCTADALSAERLYFGVLSEQEKQIKEQAGASAQVS